MPSAVPPDLVIAIDGPSGAGKSSTSRLVATRLGLAYLDTGAMYRAIAVGCMGGGLLNPVDEDGVVGFALRAALGVETDPSAFRIALNGVDVTDDIRAPEVSAAVSAVAVIPRVRAILTAQMRAIVADRRRIVVEGRDITTVVCPEAAVRVLLVADPAIRMARREAEIGHLTPAELADQVVRRDRDDSTVSQFETPAPGVTLIDSTYLSLDEVADAVIELVPAKLRGRPSGPGW